MNEEEEAISKVGKAFMNLGASPEQSQVMAAQLVKRASQLAAEKKSSLVEELGKLLETVSFGAQGRLKPEDEGDFS
ncbi:MAG: hypothetical protein VW643_07305 [Opitutales bacterium]|jgi:hypothetical protein